MSFQRIYYLRLIFVLSICISACSWLRGSSTSASPQAITETESLLRCTFDSFSSGSADRSASALERQFRMQIRGSRLSFAVRAGNCLSQINQSVRSQDPAFGALIDAWNALLPIIQSAHPDEIAMEREIRHISQQYRRVSGAR